MDAFRDIKNEEVVSAIRTRLLVHLECLMNGGFYEEGVPNIF